MKRYHLEVTTDAAGNGTASEALSLPYGEILYAVEWNDGTFDDGVNAVLSCTDPPSGVDYTLLSLTAANDDAWYFPSETEHDSTGTARTTTRPPVVLGTLKLTVSSGGNTKTGGCYVYTVEV